MVRSRNAASLLVTLTVIFLIASSCVLLARALASETHEIYDLVNANGHGRERLGAFLLGLLERVVAAGAGLIPLSQSDVRTVVTAQGQNMVSGIVSSTSAFARGMGSFLVDTAVCFFVLFFFLRDGRRMVQRAYGVLPLQIEQSRRLLARIAETLKAVVYGTLAIALLQGALTGAAFWILGVTSPVLWATVTTICALLPVVGTGLVLVPAISMLLVSGHWVKALLLVGWGLVVVHPVDNILRPYLIGNKTRLSTLFVFFSLLGGLRVFGAIGIFLGPVILSSALALFEFLREEVRQGEFGRDASFRILGAAPHSLRGAE